MMAPRMSRMRRWLRLRGMTKVTAQMSISLDGCYAGPMDPRDPQDAAGWMQGPEAPGFFGVTRWVTDAAGWRERQGYAGGERSINSDNRRGDVRGGWRLRHGPVHVRRRRDPVGWHPAVPGAGLRRGPSTPRDPAARGGHVLHVRDRWHRAGGRDGPGGGGWQGRGRCRRRDRAAAGHRGRPARAARVAHRAGG